MIIGATTSDYGIRHFLKCAYITPSDKVSLIAVSFVEMYIFSPDSGNDLVCTYDFW
jgi:hypothetical protein